RENTASERDDQIHDNKASKQPGLNTAQPDTPTPAPTKPDSSGQAHSRNKHGSDKPDAGEAGQWLAGHGHAGAIISAVAYDLVRSKKLWGSDAVRRHDGTVAISYPEGWAGVGTAQKEILPILTKAGWVQVDSFQPLE